MADVIDALKEGVKVHDSLFWKPAEKPEGLLEDRNTYPWYLRVTGVAAALLPSVAGAGHVVFEDNGEAAYLVDAATSADIAAVTEKIEVLGGKVALAATNPYPTFNDFRTAVSDRKVNGAFRSGWQPDYPSAENYLVQNFASAAADGNGSNDGDYKNPEFDALCDKAAASKSVADANKLYQQAQEVLLNDLQKESLHSQGIFL